YLVGSGFLACRRHSDRRPDRYPAPVSRRLQHRVRDVIRLQRFSKSRRRAPSLSKRRQKIGGLVHECMLVADLKTRHPPVLHIRMVGIRDVNASPSPDTAFILMIEILQSMEVVEIPQYRSVLAINFERIQRFMSTGVARRFERR